MSRLETKIRENSFRVNRLRLGDISMGIAVDIIRKNVPKVLRKVRALRKHISNEKFRFTSE
jgi:hypothetical protein